MVKSLYLHSRKYRDWRFVLEFRGELEICKLQIWSSPLFWPGCSDLKKFKRYELFLSFSLPEYDDRYNTKVFPFDEENNKYKKWNLLMTKKIKWKDIPGDSIQPADPIGKDAIQYRIAPETGVYPRKTSRISPKFRQKRSDRFLSNPTIRYCRNRLNLMLEKSRLILNSTTDLTEFYRNLETMWIHRLPILKLKAYYASKLSLLLL
jgi:hypothetical protein